MKQIPLTQDKYAIVDDADYEWLSQWKWYYHKSDDQKGYAARMVRTLPNKKYIRVFMHILINGTPKGTLTDHGNNDTLDNQRHNLRTCTFQQNCQNKTPQRNGKSAYKGVDWHKASNKWRLRICANTDREYTDYFEDEVEAAKAYDTKAAEMFGEYAKLNFERV